MSIALHIILAVLGLMIMALGLNIALGGIATLGWQGPRDFFTITNADAFAIQDNHIRFIAGVWFGVGTMFLIGSMALERFRSALIMLIIMIFLGGLARLTIFNFQLLTSVEILPSLFAELLIFPLLAFWIYKDANALDA